mmetsp:Transcript_9002/g.21088  ORF Transcript_9002/g.21088 Transcript_9002/m.21088 type:complete len:211 (+) Transcript_9002:567-1199(+)
MYTLSAAGGGLDTSAMSIPGATAISATSSSTHCARPTRGEKACWGDTSRSRSEPTDCSMGETAESSEWVCDAGGTEGVRLSAGVSGREVGGATISRVGGRDPPTVSTSTSPAMSSNTNSPALLNPVWSVCSCPRPMWSLGESSCAMWGLSVELTAAARAGGCDPRNRHRKRTVMSVGLTTPQSMNRERKSAMSHRTAIWVSKVKTKRAPR